LSTTAEKAAVSSNFTPKILVITTNGCSYPGVDNTGQQHLEYPPNSFVIRVPSPVLLPEEFYINSFRKGIDGIIVMSCGEECPYSGAFKRLSIRINKVMNRMKEEFQLEPQRLKLTAICTVCAKHVVKEITEMDKFLRGVSPAKKILTNHRSSTSSTIENRIME
jgi:F420-non-reducing hydrogenase iron-sulfur subunit